MSPLLQGLKTLNQGVGQAAVSSEVGLRKTISKIIQVVGRMHFLGGCRTKGSSFPQPTGERLPPLSCPVALSTASHKYNGQLYFLQASQNSLTGVGQEGVLYNVT